MILLRIVHAVPRLIHTHELDSPERVGVPTPVGRRGSFADGRVGTDGVPSMPWSWESTALQYPFGHSNFLDDARHRHDRGDREEGCTCQESAWLARKLVRTRRNAHQVMLTTPFDFRGAAQK